jgi:hypothetical protein
MNDVPKKLTLNYLFILIYISIMFAYIVLTLAVILLHPCKMMASVEASATSHTAHPAWHNNSLPTASPMSSQLDAKCLRPVRTKPSEIPAPPTAFHPQDCPIGKPYNADNPHELSPPDIPNGFIQRSASFGVLPNQANER